MSIFGQHDARDSVTVRSLSLRLPANVRLNDHAHPWAQLVYAVRGVLSVVAQGRRWMVPPQRGVWTPARVTHSVEAIGEAWMRTVYISPARAAALGETCRLLLVTPLLREVIMEIVNSGALDERRQLDAALAMVLVAKLAEAPRDALSLTLPTDDRALRVARSVLNAPGDTASPAELARGSGAGARTINRLFVAQTGLTFGRWRQQARLQHALRRLGEGASVTTAAFDCGYESPSAFVAMFKRALGMTPGQYLRHG